MPWNRFTFDIHYLFLRLDALENRFDKNMKEKSPQPLRAALMSLPDDEPDEEDDYYHEQ